MGENRSGDRCVNSTVPATAWKESQIFIRSHLKLDKHRHIAHANHSNNKNEVEEREKNSTIPEKIKRRNHSSSNKLIWIYILCLCVCVNVLMLVFVWYFDSNSGHKFHINGSKKRYWLLNCLCLISFWGCEYVFFM